MVVFVDFSINSSRMDLLQNSLMIFSRVSSKKGTMGALFWNCPRNLFNFIATASKIKVTITVTIGHFLLSYYQRLWIVFDSTKKLKIVWIEMSKMMLFVRLKHWLLLSTVLWWGNFAFMFTTSHVQQHLVNTSSRQIKAFITVVTITGVFII